MKLFLGNPPWRDGELYGVRAGSRWPHFHLVPPGRKIPSYIPFPFYLAYAAAVCEDAHHTVKLCDAIALGLSDEEFLEEITAFAPELVLLEVSTPSIYQDLETAKRIKQALPGVTLAFCGPHAAMSTPPFLAEHSDVDLVLYGEYEYTLRELAAKIDQPEGILGLIYRAQDEVIVNPPRPLISDLDSMPLPARHHLPMYNYCDAPAGLPLPSAVIWASRGCPFKCIFCVWPQLMYGGGSYRVRAPKNVVDELEILTQEYGFKSINFDDDTFNLGRERMLDFASEIQKRQLNIPWAIMARADTMDEEVLRALRAAGLYSLKYGVESGCQELVDRAGKKLDLVKVAEVVQLTKALGIKVHLTFSIGLPGETWQTVRKTIDFAKQLDPFSAQFSIVTPYPGSSYFSELEASGRLLTRDWSKYVGSGEAVFDTEFMSAAELREAQKVALAEWRDHVIERKINDGFNKKALSNLPQLTAHSITILRTSPLPHLKAALKVLKQKYPYARITIIAQDEVASDLLELPDIERIFTYQGGFLKWSKLPQQLQEFLQSEQPELLFCLYSTSPRNTYCDVEEVILQSRARVRGGLTLEGEFVELS